MLSRLLMLMVMLMSAGLGRGQTAVEYLAYFATFLVIAAAFASFVFMQSSEELAKRSQLRFRSMVSYVATAVRDVNLLSTYADELEVNVTLPVIFRGADVYIEGDDEKGLIYANTTIAGSPVHYYMKIGRFDVNVEQQEDDKNVITISKG